MPFPTSVRIQALVRSRRHCCVCHQPAGRASNVHHIVQEAHGGANAIENAICLCLRCHADAGHYNAQHPLGTKYSPDELRAHRDAWWNGPALRTATDDAAGTLDAYALGILEKLDDPSIAILAALAAVPAAATVNFTSDPVPDVNLISRPEPQVVVGPFDWKSAELSGVRVGWPWLIVQGAVLTLRQARLLHFHTSDARGGFGSIYLSELGQSVTQSSAFPQAQ